MYKTTPLLLALSMLVPLTGCSNRDEKPSEKSKLVGYWVVKDGRNNAIVLFEDGTGASRNDRQLEHFSWNAKSGCLVLVGSPDPSSSTWQMYDYTLSGDTLELTLGASKHVSNGGKDVQRGWNGVPTTYQRAKN